MAIAEFQEKQVQKSNGEFELDESHFGGPRKKNHTQTIEGSEDAVLRTKYRCLELRNEVMVLCILKSSKTPKERPHSPLWMNLIQKQDSIIYTDGFKTYDGLAIDGNKHKRSNHSKQYSDRKGNHINGIENFWKFAKHRLTKFHGLARKNFYLHLKESEIRYNKKHDMMKVL